MSEPLLALVASRIRVEEKRLFTALERAGIPYLHVDTRSLTASIPPAPLPYAIALSREISQTRAYYATRLLSASGVRTVNTPEVVEVCGDKLRTSLALAHHGVPVPRSAVALTTEAALALTEEIGYPCVLKPLTGSWGRLLALVRDAESATAVLEHRNALPSPQQKVVYVQEYIDKPGRDLRVITIGHRVLGAVYRYSAEWRTNVARGSEVRACEPWPGLIDVARAAARAVGGGILGIDLVEDRDGRLFVLEVNHTVEFTGFQAAHGDRVDVAAAIVEFLGTQPELLS